jgi:hypothetical protein
MKVIGKQSSGVSLVASGTLGISVLGNNEILMTNDTTFFSSSLVVSESLFASGNTQFGITTQSTHEITGSFLLTGSSKQIGTSQITGSITVTRDSTFIQDVYVSGTLKGPFSQSMEQRINALEEQRFELGGDVFANTTLTGSAKSTYTASLNISLNQISASQIIFPEESRKISRRVKLGLSAEGAGKGGFAQGTRTISKLAKIQPLETRRRKSMQLNNRASKQIAIYLRDKLSLREIARRLNEVGLQTVRGKEFTATSVKAVIAQFELKNEK